MLPIVLWYRTPMEFPSLSVSFTELFGMEECLPLCFAFASLLDSGWFSPGTNPGEGKMGTGSSSCSSFVRIRGDSVLPPLSCMMRMGFRSASAGELRCLFKVLIMLAVSKNATDSL